MKHETFWGRVTKLLKAANLSRKQFADYLQISLRTIEGWICYNRIPDAITAWRMAVLLGVTTDYLVTGSHRDLTGKKLRASHR